MGVTIKTTGLSLGDVSDKMMTAVKAELAASAFEIETKAKQNLMEDGTTDTGALAKSIGVDFEDDGLTARVVARTEYAFGIEFGRPPGTKVSPAHLVPWAKRKLRLSDKEAQSAAWAISQSIERNGSPAKPFIYPASLHGKRKLIAALQAITGKII